MGIALEKDLVGMWSPHKVKLAVSGCPRNCAESGIKDVGIIAVESGWELYVGGNGIKTEVAQFFVKVQTQDEVLEYAGAFLQLYREEAFYLERTVHYLAASAWSTPGGRWSRTRKTASPVRAAALRPVLRVRSLARERARPPRASSRSFPHERRHDNRHHHAKLVRDLPGRGHSTAGRPHRAPSRPRGHRRVPQPWRRGVRPDRPLPHKGSVGRPGARPFGHLPLAQLVVDLDSARRRRRRAAPGRSLSGSRPAWSAWT